MNINMNRDMDTIKSLYFLNTAIECGSFLKASVVLNTKESNVSRAIKTFEETLNVQLLIRNAHGVIPTETGLELQKFAVNIHKQMYEVRNYTTELHKISGGIRLWTTDGLASLGLAEYMVDFSNKFPAVNLEFIVSNELPNLGQKDADVAFVYKEPRHSDTVVIATHNIKFGLFASKSYISKYGIPKDIDDLINNHKICNKNVFNDTWPVWKNIINNAKNVVSVTNSSNMLVQLTKMGLGVSAHPISLEKIEQDLIKLDLDLGLSWTYYLITTKERKDIPKISVLLDYIKSVFLTL